MELQPEKDVNVFGDQIDGDGQIVGDGNGLQADDTAGAKDPKATETYVVSEKEHKEMLEMMRQQSVSVGLEDF
eukprot:CAMPEP_0201585086 /NCGR_PEP_ID=MMETSP0190_2-20130828/117999_1 /ASSEMBLY_ACC=CAM_ASM_000263 /TAXON_ID=37353 /ORGANISM="Rosalina sp." /LENGTH=72 /DNA_ID=CAMNT_0048030317 /DNA_START=109 /DNA_END=327 /DNA_ORIENTATION=+